MKLLTKDTDYAVRALIALSRDKNAYISSRQIADRQRVPYRFLRRILQRLTKSGLVESRAGTGGGVRLAVDPSEVTIVDVVRICQGELELSQCMFRKRACENRATCALRQEIKRIETLVKAEFEQLTVQELMERSAGTGTGP